MVCVIYRLLAADDFPTLKRPSTGRGWRLPVHKCMYTTDYFYSIRLGKTAMHPSSEPEARYGRSGEGLAAL